MTNQDYELRMAFVTKPRVLETLLQLAKKLSIDELWIGVDDQDGDGNWTNSLGDISNPPFLTTNQLHDKKTNCSMISTKTGR